MRLISRDTLWLSGATVLAVVATASLALALECPTPQPLSKPGVLKESAAAQVAHLLATGDYNNRLHVIVDDLGKRYTTAENAEIVNYLLGAECRAVAQVPGLSPQQQQARMDQFTMRVSRIVYR